MVTDRNVVLGTGSSVRRGSAASTARSGAAGSSAWPASSSQRGWRGDGQVFRSLLGQWGNSDLILLAFGAIVKAESGEQRVGMTCTKIMMVKSKMEKELEREREGKGTSLDIIAEPSRG